MVRIECDAALVEEAVFGEVRALEAAGGSATPRRYFRELESIYDLPEGEGREEAAREHHRRWFTLLGLDHAVASAAYDIGPTLGRAERIVVHRTFTPKEEGADLFGRPRDDGGGEERSVVVRLRASRFRDREKLARFLRHEFRLVADLLDPSFGARRDALPGVDAARANLVRQRYRLLWGITAEGRLARAGLEGLCPRQDWECAFDAAFGFLPEEVRRATFARFFEGPRPSHAEILAVASDPRAALAEGGGAAAPGSKCPLCSFPTYAWEDSPGLLPEEVRSRIRASFPDWTAERGICRECADRYRLLACA